jgi:hypothetical protein
MGLFRRCELLELVPGWDRAVFSDSDAWATAAVLDSVRDCEVQGAPISAGLPARNDFSRAIRYSNVTGSRCIPK